MPLPQAPQLEELVLGSLVEAYQARAGVKERMRSISEYEIARRVGMSEYSYAEYAESDERGVVRAALSRLQARGLVRATAVSGRYETFEPSAAATIQPSGSAIANSGSSVANQDGAAGVEQRLDEIIRLLRSIDARLADRR